MSDIDLTEHRACGRDSVYTIKFQSPLGNKTIVKSCSYKDLELLQSAEEIPAGTLPALPPRNSILSTLVPCYRDQRKAGVEEFVCSVIRLPPEVAQESTAVAEFIGSRIQTEESACNHLDLGALAVEAVEELEQFVQPKAKEEPVSRIAKLKNRGDVKSDKQVVKQKTQQELGKKIVRSKSVGCMCVDSGANKDFFAFLHRVDRASVHAACISMGNTVASRWKDIGTICAPQEDTNRSQEEEGNKRDNCEPPEATTPATQEKCSDRRLAPTQEKCSDRRLAPPRKRPLKHSVSTWDSTHDPFAAFAIPSACVEDPSAELAITSAPEKQNTALFRKLPSVGTWLIVHNLPDPSDVESSKDSCNKEDVMPSVSMRVQMLESLNAAKDGKGCLYMPAVVGA